MVSVNFLTICCFTGNKYLFPFFLDNYGFNIAFRYMMPGMLTKTYIWKNLEAVKSLSFFVQKAVFILHYVYYAVSCILIFTVVRETSYATVE